MKKKFLTTATVVAFVFIALTSNAQIEKGMKVLGGSVNYSGNSSDDKNYLNNGYNSSKSHSVGFTPSLGYFLTNKILLGVGVPISYSNSTYSYEQHSSSAPYYVYFSDGSVTNTRLGLNIFIRYYMNITDKFYWYIGAQAGVSSIMNKENRNYDASSSSHSTTKGNGYDVGIGASIGLTYFITPKVSVGTSLAGLSFTHGSLKKKSQTDSSPSIESTTKSNNVNFYAITSVNLSLSYYFK